MNNEPEVIDDIDVESELSEEEPESSNEERASASDEVSEDVLGDTQLGQDLGQLLSEIRRDEEKFQQSGETADNDLEPDPFDPSNFSLDTPFKTQASQPEMSSEVDSRQGEAPETATESMDSASTEIDDETPAIAPVSGASAESEEASSTISKLVSEIETALQRFTRAERQRADQLIAEKEAQVAEQYRKLRNLATKVAKQKEQIQEAKKELKAKLELADRLHIEFDGIRQVLNGKLGVLDELEKENEAAE